MHELFSFQAERLAALDAEARRILEIRQKLKAAIISRDVKELLMRVRDFRRNKIEDIDGDLARAERLLKALHIEADLSKFYNNGIFLFGLNISVLFLQISFTEKAVDLKDIEEIQRMIKVIEREHLQPEIDAALLARAVFLAERVQRLKEALKVRTKHFLSKSILT